MIIAALLVFGALLAAWLLVPAEARMPKRVRQAGEERAPASAVAEEVARAA